MLAFSFQGYDVCLDLRCGSCFDPYLGAHTSCGRMTYYDCQLGLPRACRPIQCTDTDVKAIFGDKEGQGRALKGFPGSEREKGVSGEDKRSLCKSDGINLKT